MAAKVSAGLGLGGLDAPIVDNLLSIVNRMACDAYLCVSIGRVYRPTVPLRLAKTLVLTLLDAAVVTGYRFALFFITLYGT